MQSGPAHSRRARYATTTRIDVDSTVRMRLADLRRLAGELYDVQPAADAVATVEQAAIVDVGVVARNVQRAAAHAVDSPFAGLGETVDRRDEVCHLPRMVRVANIGDPDPRVEPRTGHQLAVGR